MSKKSDEKKDIGGEMKSGEKLEFFKTWEESYTSVSKMWEDSYLKLYKPWLESTGELFGKAFELSKEATPEKYKEFYDEWMKSFQNTYGKFYQIPTPESGKEIFDKILVNAEESNKIYQSWIAELENNSRATSEILQADPDPAKYKEMYDMWIKSYGKIFDELLALPFRQNVKEIFEKLTGAPDIYPGNLEQISKLWKESYSKLYEPWIESMLKLSAKSLELSRKNPSPDAYKEFYDMWLNTFQETYGRFFDIKSMRPSKEVLDTFVKSADVNANLYRSWINTLDKMSQKTKEISKQTADPEAYKTFYNLWSKTYEKAFDSFFEYTPTISPFKKIFEPVKTATKIYAEKFTASPASR
ncbi:MAG TPA: hypothetical protein VIO11_10755 [Candidatus Methanoperedens sp.]